MTARESAGYRDIAADLRAAIDRGEYRPGDTIPTLAELEERYRVGKETVRRAVAVLRAEGLVVPVRRRGTVVRDRTPVRLSLSRYAEVLLPPGQLGPWETACARQGVSGRTELVAVERRPAGASIAAELGLAGAETEALYRLQHMYAGEQVAQIQETWLPLDIVADTPLAADQKVVGGIYRALTAIGHPPAEADEDVTSRMPTQAEAETLGLDLGSPVLAIDRVTRRRDGRVVAVVRAVAVGDRVQLRYSQTFPSTEPREAT